MKKGDRVKVISNSCDHKCIDNCKYIGLTGQIHQPEHSYGGKKGVWVLFDFAEGERGCSGFTRKDLVFITPQMLSLQEVISDEVERIRNEP